MVNNRDGEREREKKAKLTINWIFKKYSTSILSTRLLYMRASLKRIRFLVRIKKQKHFVFKEKNLLWKMCKLVSHSLALSRSLSLNLCVVNFTVNPSWWYLFQIWLSWEFFFFKVVLFEMLWCWMVQRRSKLVSSCVSWRAPTKSSAEIFHYRRTNNVTVQLRCERAGLSFK